MGRWLCNTGLDQKYPVGRKGHLLIEFIILSTGPSAIRHPNPYPPLISRKR